jgi:ABC-type multidrug transport system permease subunit
LPILAISSENKLKNTFKPKILLLRYFKQIGNIILITYSVQAIRSIMIQITTLSEILQPMVTLAASAIILYTIGILLYKRSAEKE